MDWMRHFMAGFFLVFSFFKLLNLKTFADGYAKYDLLAMRWKPYGFIYPFCELALGRFFARRCPEKAPRRARGISGCGGAAAETGTAYQPASGILCRRAASIYGMGRTAAGWYIDDLMRYEGRPYYVGLLKAAELHGATHQAVMEFQVITDKRLPRIAAGRSTLSFYYRKDMSVLAAGVIDHKTDTGRMKISSVELTVFDLLRYPQATGGMDNIATVISDLGEKIDAEKLVAIAPFSSGISCSARVT
ncbi:unnamed protein product [Sphagnum balticum]